MSNIGISARPIKIEQLNMKTLPRCGACGESTMIEASGGEYVNGWGEPTNATELIINCKKCNHITAIRSGASA